MSLQRVELCSLITELATSMISDINRLTTGPFDYIFALPDLHHVEVYNLANLAVRRSRTGYLAGYEPGMVYMCPFHSTAISNGACPTLYWWRLFVNLFPTSPYY